MLGGGEQSALVHKENMVGEKWDLLLIPSHKRGKIFL